MRPAQVWLAFAVCLGGVAAAMAWSSAIVLRLERAEVQARAQAALEENVRLALWRLDSALVPLLAQENARRSADYAPEPSALPATLSEAPAEVLLYFRIASGGEIDSPQVPTAAQRPLALRRVAAEVLDQRSRRLDTLRALLAGVDLAQRLPREPAAPAAAPLAAAAPAPAPSQRLKNVQEFKARQQTFEKANVLRLPPPAPPAPRASAHEGPLAPLWVDDALLLARRVASQGRVHVEGCWLDWPRLSAELLALVRDLLPSARLEPVAPDARPDEGRRLATLPVRLFPGPLPAAAEPDLSPTRLSLAGAWLSVLLAAGAVAALLRGVLDLSERRRVFVSAVTHELRTPLTTFRLYADMLADGMVTAEAKRREYLERLRVEAERLGHLVENVLFYSRVEGGRASSERTAIDLRALVDEAWPRLVERAARSGLELAWQRPPGGAAPVRVDRSAVEQVLLNLVDNACKYAAGSDPPRIDLEASVAGRRALLRVRDHGPGVSRAGRRRLFRPFSKSDRAAAESAPGIGLGLALSRRLARAQGGELSLEDGPGRGACFVLSLPLA